jgi:hypothetical protein
MHHGDDVLRTVDRVARALDAAKAPWAIGGSFASSVHGEPRATNDIDFVALLRIDTVSAFLAALGPEFFAERAAIVEAITRHSSFNVIDEETLVKADVFVPGTEPLGQEQLLRRRRVEVVTGYEVFVLGPEDVVLQKLRWYSMGGGVSDRQWRDIGAVLRVARDRLDVTYLREAASAGGLTELLDQALAETPRRGP